ncbi:hypothetical protein CDO30_18910 (plasmid) [Sinorhizobium meliloti]|nr:hypothetical protein SM2011_a6233 [Sinorhizobium meliloti 2011]ASP60406.1 hypothetical protein CDO30_18910 [Sinorhizobium meliloti]
MRFPSWNEGEAKQSVVSFVERLAAQGSADFVHVPERIAVLTMMAPCWPSSRCTFNSCSHLTVWRCPLFNIRNGLSSSRLPHC